MKEMQTPLEKLISEKNRIKFQSHVQEDKLNANVQYLQDHAGKLILSSATSMIFPRTQNASRPGLNKTSSIPSQLTGMALGGVSNYLSSGRGIVPLALGIARPLLITWGIKGAKKLLGNIFSKKKK